MAVVTVFVRDRRGILHAGYCVDQPGCTFVRPFYLPVRPAHSIRLDNVMVLAAITLQEDLRVI